MYLKNESRWLQKTLHKLGLCENEQQKFEVVKAHLY